MSEKADVFSSSDGKMRQFHVLKEVGKDDHVTLQITIEGSNFRVFLQDSKIGHHKIISHEFDSETLEKLKGFLGSK
jgi:hypothetical protein